MVLGMCGRAGASKACAAGKYSAYARHASCGEGAAIAAPGRCGCPQGCAAVTAGRCGCCRSACGLVLSRVSSTWQAATSSRCVVVGVQVQKDLVQKGSLGAYARPPGCLSVTNRCFKSAGRRQPTGHAVEQQRERLLVPALQVACARCSTLTEVPLAADAVSAGSQQGQAGSIQGGGTCSKCHQAG